MDLYKRFDEKISEALGSKDSELLLKKINEAIEEAYEAGVSDGVSDQTGCGTDGPPGETWAYSCFLEEKG